VNETDPLVAHLKSSGDLVKAIDAAVTFYEDPPTTGLTVTTPWADVWLGADDWAAALDAPDRGPRTTRHASRSGTSC